MSEETSQTTDTSSEAQATEATTHDSDGAVQSTTSYLDGKYESVSALEAGYNELQSSYSKKNAEYREKLGAFSGSPEGEYELPEGLEVSEGIAKYARDNQFSNEALSGLVEAHEADMTARNEKFLSEQRELLGKDADARTTNVVDWARANLGEESIKALNGMVTTAAGVEMFEKIAKISQGTAVAQVATPKTVIDRDTVKSMRFAMDEFGNRRMSSDAQYRSKVESMEAEFVGNGGKL